MTLRIQKNFLQFDMFRIHIGNEAIWSYIMFSAYDRIVLNLFFFFFLSTTEDSYFLVSSFPSSLNPSAVFANSEQRESRELEKTNGQRMI